MYSILDAVRVYIINFLPKFLYANYLTIIE